MHATKSRPNSNRGSFHKNVLARKNKRLKVSQAALDYLMSWGWVLIIIVLAIFVMYSLGIFHIPSAPTVISGFQGITMQAAQANSTMMVVKLTNNYHQVVNITGVTVSISGRSYSNLDCQDSIIPNGQTTLCRVPVSISTSSYLSNIQISFTPYRSQIYEVSNGTVSSTLVSGTIPINSQTTYFLEKGLLYGSTFVVNYNTSTKSVSVSATVDNVSFSFPFGNYAFSVPSVTYQGCTSTPSPSSGNHPTGVEETIFFKSNCVTTFLENGLPSNQQWQLSYNGTTASNQTGSSISIPTDNVAQAQVYYIVTAKSNTLACVSSLTPSIRLGGNYTFNDWNCTTTFSETGLPTTSGYNQWNVNSYDSLASSSVSTGSTVSIFQAYITTISSYTATSKSNELNCVSNPTLSVEQGSSSNTFSSWQCTTTFAETGLPSNQQWYATYNGITLPTVSTGYSTSNTQTGIATVSVYTGEGYSSNLACVSYNTPPLYQGSSYTFSAWNCTTTFSETGLPSNQQWYATYNGITLPTVSTGSSTSILQTDITSPTSQNSVGSSASLNCRSANTAGVIEGGSYTFGSWVCTTTFTDQAYQTIYPQKIVSQWTIKWDGIRGTSYNNQIQFTNTVTSVASYSFQDPFTEGGVLCVGPSGTAQMGSTVNLPQNWECYTMLVPGTNNVDVISELYSPSIIDKIPISNQNGNSINTNGNSVVTYDPQTNEFFVADSGVGKVLIINCSNDNLVTSISDPHATFVKYENGFVFVVKTNYGPDSFINVIGSNNQLNGVNTLIAGNVSGIGYYPTTGYLWIPNSSGTISTISTVKATASAPFDNTLANPYGNHGLFGGSPAYDPSNNYMYITSDSNGQFYVYSYNSTGGLVGNPVDIFTNELGVAPGQSIFVPPRDVVFAGVYPPSSGLSCGPISIYLDDVTNVGYDICLNPFASGAIFYGGYQLYAIDCTTNAGAICDSPSKLNYLNGNAFFNDGSNSIPVGDNATGIGGVNANLAQGTFIESGFPAGSSWTWSVSSYAGYPWYSTGNTIIAPVAPGNSYSYTVPYACVTKNNVVWQFSPTGSINGEVSGSLAAGSSVTIQFTNTSSNSNC